ncbi:Anthocyanidin-3-O-glucoside rhamnosyltransferase [Linum grandiflorum]
MGRTESSSPAEELHVVMFPWFAFGHISPFIQLANKLSLHGKVRISFFSAPGNIPRISNSLLSSPTTQIIPLPIPPVEGLPPGLDSTAELPPQLADLLKIALDLMQPQVKELLIQLKPDFVFFDHYQHWLPGLGSELGIKTLSFTVFSAVSTGYLTVPARIEGGKIPTVEDMKRPPKGYPETSVNQMKTFQARDFTYVYKKFKGGLSIADRVLNCRYAATALVFKSCNEIEGPYLDYLRTQFAKPILSCGPLVPEPPTGKLADKWANWLGQFPTGSVTFCSFGSETFLTDEQIEELAFGLENTELPFFLVLNFPAQLDSQTELDRALPKGFLERVKDRGVVHTGWVQQPLILAHSSVGCYLNHSGYGSLIEGLITDCQLVLLPLKGDQYLNAKLITGDMQAGIEVDRRDEDGYFGRDDVTRAVKTIMAGDADKEPVKSIRENHGKWRKFLSDDEAQNKYAKELVAQLKAMKMSA